MSWHDIMPTQGTLSDLLRKLQVKDVKVIALHFLRPDSIRLLRPVYGLVLISEWHQRDSLAINYPTRCLYFARQVNINACATSAVLSIIMNCPEVDIGPLLSELKEQTKNLSPAEKGLRVNSNEAMREAHNSLTNMIANRSNSEERMGYNFVSYLPMGGVLYELDGQKPSPKKLDTYFGIRTDGLWLEMALRFIKEQVVKHGKNRRRWTLLAFIDNGEKLYSAELEELLKRANQLTQQPHASPAREREIREVKQGYQHVHAKMRRRHGLAWIQSVKISRSTWERAHTYVKHNYLPFAVNLLKLLAEKKKLKPLIAEAKRQKSEMQQC